ncbi:MAG: hypothetical protein PHU21_07670, partial [Elusimicrobia bacterium]|nr:hypothetical protein [Elusimicrobiota bacterium]
MMRSFGLALTLCLAASAARADDLRLSASFEGGKRYRSGKIDVVVMEGDFHQMGRQYGGLMKDELKEFYEMAVKQLGVGTKKLSWDEAVSGAKAMLERNPFYVREWVRGMAETSGLGQEKQVLLSESILALATEAGCSGLMAWGDYTKDGAVLAGRNWDLGTKALAPYQKFLTVNVFNPTGFGQGVADINYAGQTLWQTAMNQSGLYYDLQNGSMSDPTAGKNRMNSN